MLPRYLASLLVLVLVFAVAHGSPIESFDEEFDGLNEIVSSLDLAAREGDLAERMHPIIVALIKVLKNVLKVGSVNCIKKIIANCIHEPAHFLVCAKDYIAVHKLKCGSPVY